MSNDILRSIGGFRLAGYFEFLDGLRASCAVNMFDDNMFGARVYLVLAHPGELTKEESDAVHVAWMRTFDRKSPPEDRAGKALGCDA